MISFKQTNKFSVVGSSREEFASEGYCILKSFLSPGEVDEMRKEIELLKTCCLKQHGLRPPPFQALFSSEALMHLRNSCSGAEVFGPNKGNCDTLGHGLHLLPNTAFHKLAHSQNLAESLRQITPQIRLPQIVQTKVIFKPAKTGSRVPTHTDEQYIFTNPISGVALWIALDPASQTNGCVQVVPKSHLPGKYESGQRFAVQNDMADGSKIVKWEEQPKTTDAENPFPYTKQEIEALEWEFAEMEAGDCLFMDVRLLHASAANTSKLQRRAITLHLVDGECVWDDKNWIQL